MLPTSLRNLLNACLTLALTATLGISGLRAQTLTIGYGEENTVSPTVNIFTGASLEANTAFIIPFQFNSEIFTDGFYLNSVSLLLSGDASLADFSLSVSSALPTDLILPSALVTFSSTGLLGETGLARTFTPNATVNIPSISSGSFGSESGSGPSFFTYYLRVAYTGTDTANWILAGNAGTPYSGSGSSPTFSAFRGTLDPSEVISYRSVTSEGYENDFATLGAFSITATAVTAVPEPATYAGIIGAATLAVALVVRRRRNRAPTA
jgi:hypothetical protein